MFASNAVIRGQRVVTGRELVGLENIRDEAEVCLVAERAGWSRGMRVLISVNSWLRFWKSHFFVNAAASELGALAATVPAAQVLRMAACAMGVVPILPCAACSAV